MRDIEFEDGTFLSLEDACDAISEQHLLDGEPLTDKQIVAFAEMLDTVVFCGGTSLLRAWAKERYNTEALQGISDEVDPVAEPFGARFRDAINTFADLIDSIKRDRNEALDIEYGAESA